ncbi:hypothetical protein OIU77_008936, partial [Salix suchowensis]
MKKEKEKRYDNIKKVPWQKQFVKTKRSDSLLELERDFRDLSLPIGFVKNRNLRAIACQKQGPFFCFDLWIVRLFK